MYYQPNKIDIIEAIQKRLSKEAPLLKKEYGDVWEYFKEWNKNG